MESEIGTRFCVVNADDFGASAGINRGIIEAHTSGILTSTSLMVNMAGTAEAIELAKAHPDLSLGLHVNFTNEGFPVIDLNDILSASKELCRQYQWFLDRVGRPPSHIDSHHNIHRNPKLDGLFIDLAKQHKLYLREHSPVRYYSRFYGQWDGESHPEHINSEQLSDVLRKEISAGFTELACHPGYITDDFESEYSREREMELCSLCDNSVRQTVIEEQIKLINYHEVSRLLESATQGVLPE